MFLKYLKKYWHLCLLTSLMVIAETVVDLIQPSMMADIVDKGVLGQDVPLIISLGIRMIIIVLIGGITGILGCIFGNMAGQNVGCDLRRDLFARTMHLSLEQAAQFTPGSLVNRVSDDVTKIQDSVKVAFRGIVRYAFMLAGGVVMLYRLSHTFALIALCGLPFVVFFVIFFLSKSTKMFASVQKKLDGVSNIMQEDVQGARVIKAFVREDHEAGRFEIANSALFSDNLKVQRLLAFLTPSMNIVLNLCVAGIILAGGIDISHGGSTTPGHVMAGITYFAIILTGASVLGNLSQTFIRARASWTRIKAVLTCEPSISDGSYEIPVTESGYSDEHPSGEVEFRGVSFAYPGSEINAIENISFSVHRGQTFGIIGPTGCGKTTLVNLIPRFFDASEGSILIDGIDVKDYKLNDLRDKISYVLQGSEMYSRSIKDNIGWGRKEASMDEITKAAQIAQADGFINESPEGYDTLVTEGGHSLSGGQKQRIAIARAILKGAEILVMDDSTSALDLVTESELYQAIEKYYPELTKIIISQRIASIRNSDIIAVMDERGHISAAGTHDELMLSSDLYRQIYDSQLKGGVALG